MMKKRIENAGEEVVDQERRKALSRLGMIVPAAYAAPVLMTLSTSAKASSTEPSVTEASVTEASVSEASVSEPSVTGPSDEDPADTQI